MRKTFFLVAAILFLAVSCKISQKKNGDGVATPHKESSIDSLTKGGEYSRAEIQLATVALTPENSCSGSGTDVACTKNGVGMVCVKDNVLGTCALTNSNKSCACIYSNVQPRLAALQTCDNSSVTTCKSATFGSACSAGTGAVAGFCAPSNGSTCSCAVYDPNMNSTSGRQCNTSIYYSDDQCTTLKAGQACSTGSAIGVCAIGNIANGCSCVTATSAPVISSNICNSSTFYSSASCAGAQNGSACRDRLGSAGICVADSRYDGCRCDTWNFGPLPYINSQTCNNSTYYSSAACTGQAIGAACASDGQSGICALSGSYSGCSCVSAPTPPNVAAVNLVNGNSNGMTFSWPAAGGSATGYRVAYKAGATAPSDCATSLDVGSSTQTTITNLNSSQYSIRVCSYDARGVRSLGTTAKFLTQPPPPEVNNLVPIINGPSSITLNWTSGGGTTSTYAYSFSTSGVPASQCTGGSISTAASVTLNSLMPSTNYKFRVCAVDQYGQYSAGVTVNATTGAIALPPAPVNLVITATSTSQLKLTWQSGGGTTNGYWVAFAAGTIAPECSVGVDVKAATSYSINGLTQGTTYTIAVCAYNASGVKGSPATDTQQTVSASTPPPPPSGLTILTSTVNSLTLSWTSGDGSTSGFYVSYAADVDVPACNAGVDVKNVTNYTIKGLKNGTNYTVELCAYNDAGIFGTAIRGSFTTAAAPPPVPEVSLGFGGAYGSTGNKAYNVINPATGKTRSCPSGYSEFIFVDNTGADFPAAICQRTLDAGQDTFFDFGGMFGVQGSTTLPNPITGSASCPTGYLNLEVLSTTKIDHSLKICYQPHLPEVSSRFLFGGVFGYRGGAPVNNPLTGNTDCPTGFTKSRVWGSPAATGKAKDFDIFMCHKEVN